MNTMRLERHTFGLLVVCLLACLTSVANAQMAHQKSSPFEALRWNGDVPEVMVDDVWYSPVEIQGVEIEAVLDFCRKVHRDRTKKRFGEDLPVVLQSMGHSMPARVDLKLIRLSDGKTVNLSDVPSTRENRDSIWLSNQEARGRNPQDTRRRTSSELSRKEALEDLVEFERRLDDQFAYRHLRDVDLPAELDRIRSGLGERVDVGDLALQLHQVMMMFGDGHAGARSRHMRQPRRFPPFLLEDAAGGVVALLPDRSAFLDPDRPYILAIDGRSIEELVEVIRPMINVGSGQLMRSRALRDVRLMELIRTVLGDAARPTITCTLARGPSDPEPIDLEVPMSSIRPIYGSWPRRESELLEGDIGYLRIDRMDDRFMQVIQSAMSSFQDTKGLIVDVRGNGGGTRTPLLMLAGYLTGPEEAPWIGNVARYRTSDRFDRDHLRARYMLRADAPPLEEAQQEAIRVIAEEFQPEWDREEGFSAWHYLVLGRNGQDEEYFYDKPVVILSDSDCFSATDIFLGAFAGRPGITLMGEPSGGGSARSQSFELPNSDIEIRCASMASFRPDGRLYDGRGIEVDVEIAAEPEYFLRNGRDNVLDAAIDYLQSDRPSGSGPG